MDVNYAKESVVQSWLSTPKTQRQGLLTYKNPQLINVIQSINSSLILKQTLMQDPSTKSYEVLECMETCWTDPVYIQVKEKYVKGRALIKLLEERFPQFLTETKTLFLEEMEWVQVFGNCAVTCWEEFEQMIVCLLEQSLLKIHYQKTELEAQKAATALMSIKIQKSNEKKKRKKPIFAQYDLDSLMFDLSSDTSTQPDTECDPSDLLFFDSAFSGSRSYTLRQKYKSRKLELSNEMLAKVREELDDVHIDWEDLNELAVVQDYYAERMPYYSWSPRFQAWETFRQYE